MAYRCKLYPGASIFLNDVKDEFDDPVQGSAGNCCLIASLSAVDWTMGRYKIKIITYRDGYKVFLNSTWVSVPGTLSLDENFQFQYAHSRILSEIWPGLYEKAVATNIHKSTADCDFSNVNWYGNPNEYLKALTGCALKTRDRSKYTLSNEIADRCVGGKVKYPMVIWNDNHCYTVLGYRPDGTFVFRDPSGTNPQMGGAITSGYWNFTNHFTWDCYSDYQTGSYGGYTMNLGRGIFALAPAYVKESFTYLSYVGLR